MAMMVLVSYDVATSTPDGVKRLRHVAKTCGNYGQRVQNSVFECLVANDQWVTLKNKLESICKSEVDSLRFYFLGSNWQHRVEHYGAKPVLDPEGPLIV